MNKESSNIPFHRLTAALVALIPVAVYFYTLTFGFVYDDNEQVLNNLWIRDIKNIPAIFTSPAWSFRGTGEGLNYYRPMMHLSYIAVYHLFGFAPWAYHLLNVLLHSANAVLLYLIAARICSVSGHEVLPRLTPFFAGLVFALHPVNTEAVSWVAALPELSYTLFVLGSFYLYIKSSSSRSMYVLSVLFFSLALLYKETASVLPLIIIMYDRPMEGPKGRLKGYLPYFLVLALYLIVRTMVVGGLIHAKQIDLTLFESLLNVPPLLSGYIGKLLLPINLNALYVFHPVRSIFEGRFVLACITVLSAVLLMVILQRRGERVLFFGLVWIFLPLLPVLYVPALQTAPFAERYLYLPVAGFSIFTAFALKDIYSVCDERGLRVLKVFVSVFMVSVMALYTLGTLKRLPVWKTDMDLWLDTVKKSPDSTNAHYNLAWAFHRAGDTKRAAIHYREAIRLNPKSADAHYNLGLIYMAEFLLDDAQREFEAALGIDPGYEKAGHGLRKVLILKGLR